MTTSKAVTASGRSHWLDLFTGTTWNEFLKAGGQVSGFREQRWKLVQKIKVGDYLLCYLTGVSRFIGLLEVYSAAYKDQTPIWGDDAFPCRVKVKPVIQLTPETAVPINKLKSKLSFFQEARTAVSWVGHVRGSPIKWKQEDGEAVVEALQNAKENPVSRPVSSAKLGRRPLAIRTKAGSVTVTEADDTEEETQEQSKEPTPHVEMQYLLLKLGSDLGLDVWVLCRESGTTRELLEYPGGNVVGCGNFDNRGLRRCVSGYRIGQAAWFCDGCFGNWYVRPSDGYSWRSIR